MKNTPTYPPNRSRTKAAARGAACVVAFVLLVSAWPLAFAQDASEEASQVFLQDLGPYESYALAAVDDKLLVAYNRGEWSHEESEAHDHPRWIDSSKGDVWLGTLGSDGAWRHQLVVADAGRMGTMAVAAHGSDVYVAWVTHEGANLTVASSQDGGLDWTIRSMAGNAALNLRLVATEEGASLLWQETGVCHHKERDGPGLRHWEAWTEAGAWKKEVLWSHEGIGSPSAGSGRFVTGVLSYQCGDNPWIANRLAGQWLGSSAPYESAQGQPLVGFASAGAILATSEVAATEESRTDETVFYVQFPDGTWSRHVSAVASPEAIAALDSQRMAIVYSDGERDAESVNNYTWRVVLASTGDAGLTWDTQEILSGDQDNETPSAFQMVLGDQIAFVAYQVPRYESMDGGRPDFVGNDLRVLRVTGPVLHALHVAASFSAEAEPSGSGVAAGAEEAAGLKDVESGQPAWILAALGVCGAVGLRRRR